MSIEEEKQEAVVATREEILPISNAEYNADLDIIDILLSEAPELEDLWIRAIRNEIRNKELEIKVTFPFKKVASFVVIKQFTIVWRNNDVTFPWKLYVQTLISQNTEDDSETHVESGKRKELVTRIIWSKGGKFFHRMSPFIKPQTMKIVNSLIQLFGMDSDESKDIVFPFN